MIVAVVLAATILSPEAEFEKAVEAGRNRAIVVAQREECREVFAALNPDFDTVRQLRHIDILPVGPMEFLAIAGRQGLAASSCMVPDRIAMLRSPAAFFGGRFVAHLLLHELGHLAQCGINPPDEKNEERARLIAEACGF